MLPGRTARLGILVRFDFIFAAQKILLDVLGGVIRGERPDHQPLLDGEIFQRKAVASWLTGGFARLVFDLASQALDPAAPFHRRGGGPGGPRPPPPPPPPPPA